MQVQSIKQEIWGQFLRVLDKFNKRWRIFRRWNEPGVEIAGHLEF